MSSRFAIRASSFTRFGRSFIRMMCRSAFFGPPAAKSLSHVVCRPTEQEARDYLKHFGQDQADWAAVGNLVRLQFVHAQSFPHDLLALIRERGSRPWPLPLVGTPGAGRRGHPGATQGGLPRHHPVLRRLCRRASLFPGHRAAAARRARHPARPPCRDGGGISRCHRPTGLSSAATLGAPPEKTELSLYDEVEIVVDGADKAAGDVALERRHLQRALFLVVRDAADLDEGRRHVGGLQDRESC